MNNHLKSAFLKDKRRKKNLISPISKTDSEIIWELIIVLGKLEIHDIKSILEHWKFLKDEQIYELLLEWNIEHPEGFNEDDSENKAKRKFIEFDNSMTDNIKTSVNFNDTVNYMSFSEGEKKKIDMAILLSFIDVTKKIANWNCNLLVIDELLDSSIDDNGLEKLLESLEKMVLENDGLGTYIISHRVKNEYKNFFNDIRYLTHFCVLVGGVLVETRKKFNDFRY